MPENKRLLNSDWKKWGPYLTDRQWGTVREDYSSDGEAWQYITHDEARSKAYCWGGRRHRRYFGQRFRFGPMLP